MNIIGVTGFPATCFKNYFPFLFIDESDSPYDPLTTGYLIFYNTFIRIIKVEMVPSVAF